MARFFTIPEHTPWIQASSPEVLRTISAQVVYKVFFDIISIFYNVLYTHVYIYICVSCYVMLFDVM